MNSKSKALKKVGKDMSNKSLGNAFLKSKFSKDIPKERKEMYRKYWNK